MHNKESAEQSEELRRRTKEITLTEAFHALALWLFNLSSEEKVEAVYGKDLHGSYKREKMDVVYRGFSSLWGDIDSGHRDKLVNAVIDRYGEEAMKR